ncbi:SLC25A13 [Branchiostoma lanceolatum]|uniref:Mitochondrial S-adenosylmethionine carrier protein n=1 Tax=Branchiostoma lanceolatum TaxID=7740 RepID=A0A8J9W4W0_BRALA|nr:SLC25A13 [Branchiostoma lanceolatum]
MTMGTQAEARLCSTRPSAPPISPGAARGRADYLPKNWQLYSAGVSMAAGGVTQVVHHPLFTLKTFIQTPNFSWKDFLGRTVNSPVGFLYRGVVSRSLGVMPERMLKMQGWFVTTKFLTDLRGEQSLGIWILGGLAAGVGTAVVASPTELLMVRAQVHGHRVRDVWKTTGYMNITKGMYKGFAPALVRDLTFNALFFVGREAGVRRYETQHGHRCPDHKRFQIGFVAGSISCTAATPMDAVKTRIQAAVQCGPNSQRGAIFFAKSLLREGGILRLWQGLGARLMIFPSTLSLFYILQEKMEGILLHRLSDQGKQA